MSQLEHLYVSTGPQPLFQIPSPLPGNTPFLGRGEGWELRASCFGFLLQEEGRGLGTASTSEGCWLRKGSLVHYDISGPFCPQPRSESLGSSSDKTLPSITEAEGGMEPGGGPRPRRPLLLSNLSPARPRGSLVSLLGEELPPFSALVSSPSLSPSPSPALAGRGHSPSPLAPPRGSAAWKPPQLLIPSLGTFGPPDLSPR